MPSTVSWAQNNIKMWSSLTSADAFKLAKALDVVATKQGYPDVTLDFSEAYPVREGFMVPAIALIREYRRKGTSFSLIQPTNTSGRSLFHNANWAFLIDDVEHAQSTFEGEGHLPASAYRNQPEQAAAIDRIMSMILKVVPLERKQFGALEWSVNEIADNVLNHSQSQMGGVIQASSIMVGQRPMVEFVVADAGIGIARSLNEGNNVRALERAVQEGVTRNPATNQGNGLYGTFRVSTLSNGRFELHSYRASLQAEGLAQVRARRRPSSLYPGTIVLCRIGCDDEKLIEQALTFKGKVHEPGFDYIEKKFEADNANVLTVVMHEQCSSFGSREAGITARTMIENLLRAEPTYPLIVDFSGIMIISSSFADEVFGRLFVALGPMAFMSRISFVNVESSVRAILDRAISQRMKQAMT